MDNRRCQACSGKMKCNVHIPVRATEKGNGDEGCENVKEEAA
jgi:hypothetical protein